MPYEVFRKNFFAHMNELEITPGKVRLDEAIRLIVCQKLSLRSKRYSLGFAQGDSYLLYFTVYYWTRSEQ